ncbi:MAG: anaerobic ribonucleoside-triphosphate reductase activating protein [Lachnospiraceae bacterium]|nr:anaerobic ribonucleoside-triphosphate reductase activating protein [Lachnospiraceae bacterium]
MRYAQIRSLDLSNGEGIGVALFVQGCRFRCPHCFNPETWDFSGGKEWTSETKDRFIELTSQTYIKRLSILGGEPLAEENLDGVLDLVNEIRLSCPQKTIWLYTGYTWEECEPFKKRDPLDPEKFMPNLQALLKKRYKIISQCHVLVDGRYIDSQRDITLPYRGSKNQRLIDIQKSLQKGEIVLWQT